MTTGRPQASASSAAMPNPSRVEGMTQTCDDFIRLMTSLCESRNGLKRTLSSIARSRTRDRMVSRSGPLPSISRVQSGHSDRITANARTSSSTCFSLIRRPTKIRSEGTVPGETDFSCFRSIPFGIIRTSLRTPRCRSFFAVIPDTEIIFGVSPATRRSVVFPKAPFNPRYSYQ